MECQTWGDTRGEPNCQGSLAGSWSVTLLPTPLPLLGLNRSKHFSVILTMNLGKPLLAEANTAAELPTQSSHSNPAFSSLPMGPLLSTLQEHRSPGSPSTPQAQGQSPVAAWCASNGHSNGWLLSQNSHWLGFDFAGMVWVSSHLSELHFKSRMWLKRFEKF